MNFVAVLKVESSFNSTKLIENDYIPDLAICGITWRIELKHATLVVLVCSVCGLL